MSHVDGLYIQVNLFSLLVIFRLIKTVLPDIKSQYEAKLFYHVLIFTSILAISDICWVLISHCSFSSVITVNHIINMVYFLASACIGISWFIFCEYVIGIRLDKNNIITVISFIPFAVLVAAVLLSPWLHLIFYIDSNNVYHRGDFHFIQWFCMNIYFLITAVQGIRKLFDKNDLAQKKKYISISTLILWAFVAHILQIIIPGYPTIEIGLTIALLSVFVELRNSIISIDPLTQINNRGQLLKYLSQKFKSLKETDETKNLYLMVMDVDSFKQINDNFGHLEGDEALKLVAKSLKKVAANHNYFICRYGGDEFILVCEKENDSEADELASLIRKTIGNESQTANRGYCVSVSVGYARRSEECLTAADLIKNADDFMYKNKKSKKAGSQRDK